MKGVYRAIFITPSGAYWSIFNGIPYRWVLREGKWHLRRMKRLPADAMYPGRCPPWKLIDAVIQKCKQGNSVWKHDPHRKQPSVKDQL